MNCRNWDRSAVPEVKPFPYLTLEHPVKQVLPLSGLGIELIEGMSLGMAQLTLIIPGGHIETGSFGLTTIAYSLLNQGTSDLTSAQIAEAFDSRGATFSTRCTQHHTSVTLLSHKRHFPELMELLKVLFTKSNFEEKTCDRLKLREKSLLAQKKSQIEYAAEVEMRKILFGYRHPAASEASAEEIDNISSSSCREIISKALTSQPSAVILTGEFDKETTSAVDSFLTIFTKSSPPQKLSVKPMMPAKEGLFHIGFPDSVQSYVSIAQPIAIDRYSEDYPALRIAVTALGDYFGSRLVTEIRERLGLVYHISSNICVENEGAYLLIEASTAKDNIPSLIEATMKCVNDLAQNPPRGEEFHTLRMQVASYYAQITESPFRKASQAALKYFFPVPDDYFDRQQKALAKLEPETISEISAKYFHPDSFRILTVGDS